MARRLRERTGRLLARPAELQFTPSDTRSPRRHASALVLATCLACTWLTQVRRQALRAVTCRSRLSFTTCARLSGDLTTFWRPLLSARAVRVQVLVCEGAMRALDGTFRKHFAAEPELVPLELALRCHPAGVAPRSTTTAIAFQPGDAAIFLGVTYFGWRAQVLPRKAAGVDQDGAPIASGGAARMLALVPLRAQ